MNHEWCRKHAENARMRFKNHIRRALTCSWLKQKKLSTVMTWWYCPIFFDFADLKLTKKEFPESTHQCLGVSDRHSSKKRPPNLGKPTCNSHELPERSESPKMGIPTSCLQSKIQSPIPALKPFFRLVRKGQKLLPAVWGDSSSQMLKLFFLGKKTFQTCSIICLIKFVITEKKTP